jgi:hypothetical protein
MGRIAQSNGSCAHVTFQTRELAGYDAYRERIRYRLIPFVWYAGRRGDSTWQSL